MWKRKRLKKRFLKLYKLRSAISHGGRKEILEADVHELKIIAGLLTKYMINHKDEFQSRETLFEWFELKRLSV